MTTYYVDFEFGDDTAAGTAFATRKQTLSNVMDVATSGDIIRVKESPAERDAGQWVWSKVNTHIWVNSNITAAINVCDTAWSQNTSVTSSQNTGYYIIDNSTDAFVAAAANPGRLIHGLTEQIDYSQYRYVNLYLRSDITLTAGQLQLRLCSDTGGATAVHTLNLPSINTTGWWHAIVLDPGSNLNSSIQSVALYQTADLGEFRVHLDNIFASKPNNVTDHITLKSFVRKAGGQNKEPWYPVRWIANGPAFGTVGTGTRIGLATGHGATRWMNPMDIGIQNVSANMLVREAIFTAPQSTYYNGVSNITKNGIRVTGGWDRAAMTTTNSITVFSGVIGRGVGMNVSGSDVTIENMQCSWYGDAFDVINATQNTTLINCVATTSDDTGFSIYPTSSNTRLQNCFAIGNYFNGLYCTGKDLYVFDDYWSIGNWRGLYFDGNGGYLRNNAYFTYDLWNFTTGYSSRGLKTSNIMHFQSDNVLSSTECVTLAGRDHRIFELRVNDFAETGVIMENCYDTDIFRIRANAVFDGLIKFFENDKVRIHHIRAVNMPTGHVAINLESQIAGSVRLGNVFVSGGTEYAFNSYNRSGYVTVDHRQGIAGNLYSPGLLTAWKESTPSGNAGTNVNAETSDIMRFQGPHPSLVAQSEYIVGADYPLTFTLAKGWVRAGQTYKANLWLKNSNNFQNNCGIMVDGWLSRNPTLYANTKANLAATYDEVFIQYTPNYTGPVELKYVHTSVRSANAGDYVWALKPDIKEVTNDSGVLSWITTHPTIALGLRKLNASYTGALVRVRRSSDSTESNIGFTENGHLDYATFSSFVGGGSGFIRTWFDQSGAGNHAQQETTTLQPMLRLDVYNGRPCLTFHGANALVIADSDSYKHAFLYHQAFVKSNVVSTLLVGHPHSNTHVSPFFRWCIYHAASGALNIRVNTDDITTTPTPFAGGQPSIISYWNQSRIAYANGAHLINSTDATVTYNANVSGIHFGENGGGTERMTGDWMEYIQWKENLRDYERRFLTSNQGATFGITIASDGVPQ